MTFFGGGKIYPVVAYSIKIDIRAAVNRNQYLLVLPIHAACFGRATHLQTFTFMILNLKTKSHKFKICLYFVLNSNVVYFHT